MCVYHLWGYLHLENKPWTVWAREFHWLKKDGFLRNCSPNQWGTSYVALPVSGLLFPNILFATLPGIQAELWVRLIKLITYLSVQLFPGQFGCILPCLWRMLPISSIFLHNLLYPIMFSSINSICCFLKIYFKKKFFPCHYRTHSHNCSEEG